MPTLYLATACAGMVYILTPGPGMLALMTTVAGDGRQEGIRFLIGDLVGDALWAILGLASILGLSSVGPKVSALLGVFCGTYLIILGARALLKPSQDRSVGRQGPRSFRAGLILGLTNPKSYPVFVALFGAALSHFGRQLDWTLLPGLMLSAGIGFLIADAALLLIAGLPAVRVRFLRYRRAITRGIGVVFLVFGAKLTVGSVRQLLR